MSETELKELEELLEAEIYLMSPEGEAQANRLLELAAKAAGMLRQFADDGHIILNP